MPKSTLLLSVFAAFLLLSISPVQARRSDEIDSDQRLQLLRQATGTPSAPVGTFQARLDSIMNTSASTERMTVATEDAQERQKILALERPELLEEELEPEDPASMRKMDKTKIANVKVKLKEDHSEEGFQKTRDAISSEFDQRIQKASNAQQIADSQKTEADAGSLPPSLANNPFYFSTEKRESLFKDRKAIIVSRIMGASNISAADAESLVSQSSSSEELILQLMQEHGMTYGEASDIVS
jgi:hypothetical protein